MRIALRKTSLETRATATTAESGRTALDIDLRGGSIVVRDPRVFEPARRKFCLRLLEAAVRQPDVRAARIDLAASTCQLDFARPAQGSHAMAERFATAVRQALAPRADRGESAWLGSSGDTSTLTAYPAARGASVWEATTTGTGRVRLRHRALASGYAGRVRLAAALQNLAGVRRCIAGLWAPVLTVDLEPNGPPEDQFLDTIEHLRSSLNNEATGGAGTLALRSAAGSPAALSGAWRVLNAVLAGGCLALTGVALLIPGLPTIPFLLATSYYLARSSPRFDGMLHRTPIIGSVLTEWEMDHGLSGGSKRSLIGLMVSILLLTLVLFPVSTVSLVLMLALFAVSVRSVVRMPGLPPAGSDDASLPAPAPAAIVGPVA